MPPLFEFVTPIPYTMLQQMIDDSAPWGILAYEKACYLDELTDGAIAVIAEHFPRKSSPMSIMPVFPMGGAYHDPADDDTAFGGSRASKWLVNISAIAPDPELLAADRAWVRTFWDALQPYASGSGSYVNFLNDPGDESRVRASYGAAKYDRLARIKAQYDPDNIFHRKREHQAGSVRIADEWSARQRGTSTTRSPACQSGSCATTSPLGSTSAASPGMSSSNVEPACVAIAIHSP